MSPEQRGGCHEATGIPKGCGDRNAGPKAELLASAPTPGKELSVGADKGTQSNSPNVTEVTERKPTALGHLAVGNITPLMRTPAIQPIMRINIASTENTWPSP